MRDKRGKRAKCYSFVLQWMVDIFGINGILIAKRLRMQAQDVQVTIRVNRELKENAETLFDYLGLNMSNAVNIFLQKAVDQKGIPFSINTDNYGIGGLGAEKITQSFNDAVKQDIAQRQAKGLPIARYDVKSGQAFLENTDGTREYV